MDTSSDRRLDRSNIRVVGLHDPDTDSLAHTFAAERFGMMRQLTLDGWEFKEGHPAESRLQRHIERVIRPER